MSPYYKYEFTSIEPTIALIKEEFKSYLDTGAIDDVLWPIYVNKCLSKLGKGMLEIKSDILNVCDYECRLPEDFNSVREAWLCTTSETSFQAPGSTFQEVKIVSTSSLLSSNQDISCSPCASCQVPNTIKAIYKTTNEVFQYYHKQYLLRPGSIHTQACCGNDSPNLGANCTDTFDIRGNKFVTNFRSGTVNLLYYAVNVSNSGYQWVPNNYRILEYIEAFIKQKVCEQLSNQVTDETYNQIQGKAMAYEQKANEAFIMAEVETKKETVDQKAYKIRKQRGINRRYDIS